MKRVAAGAAPGRRLRPGGRTARHRPSARPQAGPALRRRAPARGHRPRPARQPAPPADGRAAGGARPRAQAGDPALPGTPARRAGDPGALRQPRARRGGAPGRSSGGAGTAAACSPPARSARPWPGSTCPSGSARTPAWCSRPWSPSATTTGIWRASTSPAAASGCATSGMPIGHRVRVRILARDVSLALDADDRHQHPQHPARRRWPHSADDAHPALALVQARRRRSRRCWRASPAAPPPR